MPAVKEQAAEWFHSKWGVPKEAYLECMNAYSNKETEYGWYLCLDGERIIGGLGVIENDFHDRKDLTPNVCAVYTEEKYRGRGIAGKLLNMVLEDMKEKEYHSEYLMRIAPNVSGAILGIGWNYIRFGIEEPHLFRFLFQSNYFSGATLVELIDADELLPVLLALQNKIGGSIEQVKNVFLTVFLFAHGYASFIVNNALVCDEKKIKTQLEAAYRGAILAEKEKSEWKS